jgi:hypothetical protein
VLDGVLAVLAHTARRTCRRNNRGNAKSDGARVRERTATRKSPNVGRAGMGTHPSRKPRSCPPSRSNLCIADPMIGPMGNRRAGVGGGFGEAWASAMPVQDLQRAFRALRLALYALEVPSNFQGAAHHELVPLLILGGPQHVRHVVGNSGAAHLPFCVCTHARLLRRGDPPVRRVRINGSRRTFSRIARPAWPLAAAAVQPLCMASQARQVGSA